MNNDAYDAELRQLQIAMIGAQKAAIKEGRKVLVIFEGRDAAGKDGSIARIVAPLSRRETRVVALPKPSDRERSQWFLQRYVAHLPAAGEFALFNRSWYNRAGVEKVMGFSEPEEQEEFLRDVPAFERMLVDSGMKVVKFWLDISREEQAKRLEARRKDPLKAFKISPLDDVAQARWDDYTAARDEMLRRTHSEEAPWICVRADHKKPARLNILRWLLPAVASAKVCKGVEKPDSSVVFRFEMDALGDGRLAR
ncbi:MAG: polyphosphate kinase 2 [Caulobacter sp.]|nr:polyphosphate kinase 2 [Caulobacter sp.]